jgi:serine protease Do
VRRGSSTRDITVTLDALDGNAIAATTPARPAAAANALGLAVEAVDAETRRALGLRPGEGVRISRVGSPLARQAGLSVGDVVLAVNGSDVGSPQAFEAALARVKRGETLRLLVRNAGSTGFVELPMP